MNTIEFQKLLRAIVRDAKALKDKHTSEHDTPVNYVAIFSHSADEYEALLALARLCGRPVHTTPTGPLFHIAPLDTVAGLLKLLKVRAPDPNRLERGDADFTVTDYAPFKRQYLSKPGFKLIPRENFEMVELIDPSFNVLAYFSNPPLDQQLGIV